MTDQVGKPTKEHLISERGRALILAAAILDRPSGDPDDDLAVLARQLTRAQEAIDKLAEQRAELLAALEDALLCMETGCKVRDASWDGTATSESSIGKARTAINNARATGATL